MIINEVISNFKQDIADCYSPDIYLIRFKELLSALINEDLDLSMLSEQDVKKFVHDLPITYNSSIPTEEQKQANGTIKIAPRFKPFALSKSGYDPEKLLTILLEKREASTKINIACKNDIGEFIEILKKTYWNIKPADVSKFVIGMMEQVYNTQLAAGMVEGDPIQSFLYIQSPTEGTGKSYATAKICSMANDIGMKASTANYPDRDYPAAKEFATNHFSYIDETVSSNYKNVDQEQWMAIMRRFYITIKEKYEKPYKLRARGGIVCLGNCSPVYGAGKVVYTMDHDIRNNTTLRNHLLSIVNSHSCVGENSNLFTSILLDKKIYEFFYESIQKSFSICEKNEKSEDFLSLPIVKILQGMIQDGIIDDVFEPAYENNGLYDVEGKRNSIIPAKFNAISANKLMKEAGINKTDSGYTNIRSKLIIALRALQSEGFITKVDDQRNGVEYTKYDITPIVNIDWSKVNPPTNYDTPEKEVLATIEEYDRIKQILLDAYPTPPTPTDPTPTNDDDLDKLLAEIEWAPDTLKNEDIPDVVEQRVYDTIDEPEHTYKDQYATTPTDNPTDQFETLNPTITGGRKDTDCISRRNFIFEMDDTPLEEQKQYIKKLHGVINRFVYSGSKSIHMRITANKDIDSIQEYKFIWKKLNNLYFNNKADKACSNPARLTRHLNGIRAENGKRQVGRVLGNYIVDITEFKEAYNVWDRNERIRKELIHLCDNRKPRKYNTIQETIDHWKDSETKESIQACLNGNGTYEDGLRCLVSMKWAGFTYKEICSEINFGSWNFKESFYDEIEV